MNWLKQSIIINRSQRKTQDQSVERIIVENLTWVSVINQFSNQGFIELENKI